MALNQEAVEDAELTKNYIINYDLSDKYKSLYVKLLSISTMATNGITPDEKIQKMTETIQLLVIAQGIATVDTDKKIAASIAAANLKQCSDCKAMKYVTVTEQHEHEQEIIDEYKKANGLIDADEGKKASGSSTMTDSIFKMLASPYPWIAICVSVFSPFAVDIVKALLAFFAK